MNHAATALRTPPHAIHSEQALLGIAMTDHLSLPGLFAAVRPEHFFRREHATIFSAIAHLAAANQGTDPVTVSEHLDKTQPLPEGSWLPVTGQLVREVPFDTTAPMVYAASVRSQHGLRQLVAEAEAVVNLAYNGPGDAAARLQAAATAMTEMAVKRTHSGFVHVKDLIRKVVDDIEKRFEAGGRIPGAPSGLKELDALTNGFEPGQLVVVGGRPSMGKTALAMDFTAAAAAAGTVVGVFSLEMSGTELASRMLAAGGRLDLAKFRSGRFDDSDWHRLTNVMTRIAEYGIHIDDTAGTDVHGIVARAKALKAQQPDLGMVVVDYLQLIATDSRRHRNDTVGEISRAMKILARELAVPVILLSQLNRELERRNDKRPTLADLRDSGAIEQDADIVVFVYRDEIYNEDSPDAGTAELIVAKQRNGPTGKARVAFHRTSSTFADLDADGSETDLQQEPKPAWSEDGLL